MAVLIQVTGLMAGMVVVRPCLFGHSLVPVPLWVEVARRVPRVIMVLARDFLGALITVAVLVEVARNVPGVVVMLTWFLLRHGIPRNEFFVGRGTVGYA